MQAAKLNFASNSQQDHARGYRNKKLFSDIPELLRCCEPTAEEPPITAP